MLYTIACTWVISFARRTRLAGPFHAQLRNDDRVIMTRRRRAFSGRVRSRRSRIRYAPVHHCTGPAHEAHCSVYLFVGCATFYLKL